MRISSISLALGAAALILPIAAEAQQRRPNQANWRVIGFKVVNGSSDTDTVRLPGQQRFRQLRLCAYNAPLRLRDFDVQFENGGRQDVSTRERINPGTCTRAIDLKGQRRDITRVTLRYDRIQRGMRVPLVRVSAR